MIFLRMPSKAKYLLLFLISLFLYACDDDDCSGAADAYDIQGVEASLGRFQIPPETYDDAVFPEDIDLPSEQLAIKINVISNGLASLNSNPLFRFSLFSIAHACSPALPLANDPIKSLVVTSDRDFNSELSFGESLNTVFVVEASDTVYEKYDSDLGEYVKLTLDEFNSDMERSPRFLRLRLSESPDTTQDHQFSVDVTLESGVMFQVALPPVLIGVD